jgi:hypothetical protein
MPSVLSTSGKNVMLDQLGTLATHLSLHGAADPTDSGTGELTGGSPAYARKAASWAAASAGSKALSGTYTFDVPASTVGHVGLKSALTAGTHYGHWDVTDEVFAAQGQYTLTSGTISL